MIEFIHPYRLAVARPHGSLNARLLRQMIASFRQLERTEPVPFDRLIDLSRISDVRISIDEVFEIARARRSEASDLAPCRAAVLAPGRPSFAAAELYQLVMEHSPLDIQVCGSAESAAEWLRLPSSAVLESGGPN